MFVEKSYTLLIWLVKCSCCLTAEVEENKTKLSKKEMKKLKKKVSVVHYYI